MSRTRSLNLPVWLDQRLGEWLRRTPLHKVAMILALVPLVIPLSIGAVAMFALLVWRSQELRRHLRLWAPVLLIAAINIAVSAWALSELSEALLRALIDWWGNMPVHLPRPDPNPDTSGAIAV